MRKLSLDLDTLVVESFETAQAPGLLGTIRGNQDSGALGVQFSCDPDACGGGGESMETACGPCGTGAAYTCAKYCSNAATCGGGASCHYSCHPDMSCTGFGGPGDPCCPL